MNTRLHPQAVQLHLFAEKRLCFGYFSAEAPTPESKVETTKESLAKLPRHLAGLAAPDGAAIDLSLIHI